MSDMIERVALNLRLAGMCHTHAHSVQTAQAAIAAMQADADLDRIKRERDQAVEALQSIADRPSEGVEYIPGYGDIVCSEARHMELIALQALASIEGTGHE